MTQESNNSQSSTNSETKQSKKSVNTTTKKSSQELEIMKSLGTIESNLIEGLTLTEILKDKNLNPSRISLMKFYAILKKNPELNSRVSEARKIGIQTLIDKLLQVFNHQEVENPNQILWIREKTRFIQYLAGKLTDLYSDNKPIKQNIDQRMTIQWEDTPDLIDVGATDITPTPPKD
tara:strand:+ start:391 stop:921 length:531 start_codon:yes stop_codon:yes gene_type:complete